MLRESKSDFKLVGHSFGCFSRFSGTPPKVSTKDICSGFRDKNNCTCFTQGELAKTLLQVLQKVRRANKACLNFKLIKPKVFVWGGTGWTEGRLMGLNMGWDKPRKSGCSNLHHLFAPIIHIKQHGLVLSLWIFAKTQFMVTIELTMITLYWSWDAVVSH